MCSVQFCPVYPHGGIKYCSDECTDQANRAYRKKYGNKWRKIARNRGVDYEPVNRIKVFDRDGWKCQICGKSAPRKWLNTHRPNAPELDHRKPISKGGGHTYANTQCAHRSCNIAKSNKRELGQLPLYNQ
jgi:5-methylcytosine-specific restriction endonuclease McrA